MEEKNIIPFFSNEADCRNTFGKELVVEVAGI
jgi:hypothetical protein